MPGDVIDGIPGHDTIAALQRFRNFEGFNAGTVDGLMGPQTMNAFKGWANHPRF